MAVWEHLSVSKAHVAYACVGVFSSIFSLVSLFVKEKLYIGESTVAGIFGLIVGPVCLNWFNPLKWGNSDSITLEITRIVLCLQIFAVAVELPRKYMLKHWLSVVMLLFPVMTTGWLIIGLFVWIVIPGLNFSESLLISACITATDPILAQSVVSGKFAQKVPGHLRNLLSAESGCNDGMAFPFIFLSLNLIIHPGNGREIVKDWICVTLLYECIFGCILGVFIGYIGRRAIRFAEEKNIIDRESFLAFYVVLAFCCAGFGSILGVDDLLVSFAAGAAFAWDGWFSQRTEESKVSTVIDLLLNYAYFIYFGAIIPWSQFNNGSIGLNVWRLIILSIVVIFLRRIPAVMLLKPIIPDIKSWREALFVGHFGPIGVGAVFAAILARAELEDTISEEPTPLARIPPEGTKHYQLIACIWPTTCFFIVTSIIVHGSSVAVVTLGRHLNTITLTKTFTTHTTNGGTGKSTWMTRLPSLDKSGRSFSLQRVDTHVSAAPSTNENIGTTETVVETSGIPTRAVGGMTRKDVKKRKRQGRKRKRDKIFHRRTLSNKYNNTYDDELNDLGRERLQREREAQAATFALSSANINNYDNYDNISSIHSESESERERVRAEKEKGTLINQDLQSFNSFNNNNIRIEVPDVVSMGSNIPSNYSTTEMHSISTGKEDTGQTNKEDESMYTGSSISGSHSSVATSERERRQQIKKDEDQAHIAYQSGDQIIIENKHGEILNEADLKKRKLNDEEANNLSPRTSRSSSLGSGKLSKILTGPFTKDFNLSPTQSYESDTSLRTLKKILTPPEGIRKSFPIPQRGSVGSTSKYHAYKMDNLLIIENNEGDVLRRYKITPRERSNSNSSSNATTNSKDIKPTGVVNKALTAVGLRSRNSSLSGSKKSNTNPQPTTLQRGRNDPQTRMNNVDNVAAGAKTGKPRPLTPIPTQEYSSEEEDDDDDDEQDPHSNDDGGNETEDDYDYDTEDESNSFESDEDIDSEREGNETARGVGPLDTNHQANIIDQEPQSPAVESRESPISPTSSTSATQKMKSTLRHFKRK
ncbi:Nha1p NDAI_0G02500 [Naumovozyma dairenensis CBS 421]|uniref:Cation/H+ exchanger domain-containing protein n=1 Tax=Naumovozyma dairenensis (strain ATCC 10597 / BCRC 20456 / CBS 421 / NBRC 0211 / NRRL Y-12639) TaxID=1071378 RepID=G0WE15_NAUDC|nr:hypothetical protein NDAI_0G02500 [Naumovozyma dairenensis CBS 421]CCD26026.2 hypothetical protein NDAI_0G02500 [Naumovozyma dairenensis CBS 421]